MLLSIIIVNYNAKFFLEQCLYSVQQAILSSVAISLTNKSEIFVIDNHSEDGSLQWLAPNFPNVSFISNQENIGFGRANNQGLLLAKGQYVLFLNPDCILSEDCLEKCISLIEADPMVAATGVKMIDGS
jgi:GT2 family glycosyltransferase